MADLNTTIVIHCRTTMARDRILIFGGNLKPDRRQLGGKVLGLLASLEAGFDTPEGLVVRSDVFTTLMEESFGCSWAEMTLARLEAEGLARVRQRIESFVLPPSLRAWLDHQLSAIAAPYGFAVRSSAAFEDGPQQSFAGVFQSLLGPRNLEEIAHAVRQVWASAFSEMAFHCYHRLGRSQVPEMAVLIQKLLKPEVSGVAFTVNPDSGNFHEMLLIAARGMGRGVVSGQADTDTYCLEKTPSGIQAGRREIPRKKIYQELDGRLARYEADDPAATAALLHDACLLELGRIFQELELHRGRPLDIEWAIAGGRPQILQARPLIPRLHHYCAEMEPWQDSRLLVRSVFAVQEQPGSPLFLDLIQRGPGRYLLQGLQQGDPDIRLSLVSSYPYISLPFDPSDPQQVRPQAEQAARSLEKGIQRGPSGRWKKLFRRGIDAIRRFLQSSPAEMADEPHSVFELRLREYERIFDTVMPDLFILRRHIDDLLTQLQDLEHPKSLSKDHPVTDAWPLSALNRLAERVVEEHCLRLTERAIDRQQAIYVTLAEASDGQLEHDELKRRIRQRQVEREYYAGFRPPPPLIHHQEPLLCTPREHPSLFRGIAVAGGQSAGPVRLFRDGLRKQDLPADCILVCPIAVLACAELFPHIGGLVVEDNRTLTHSLILARELGLPTVAGVRGISALVRDGDHITLHGEAGVVEIDGHAGNIPLQ